MPSSRSASRIRSAGDGATAISSVYSSSAGSSPSGVISSSSVTAPTPGLVIGLTVLGNPAARDACVDDKLLTASY
ncbi:hypothetical protein GCM10009679_26180 [Saccharothrix algeriensis]|uniref:Uncharacterized protein n=1 Tax=Catellatospora bangladeshensis TaxID=310355 RepID=A0A8J3NJG8_9ACTN|nr:hypothetical protein Cba03nite_27950 [Catellatospora bangladeshensis]